MHIKDAVANGYSWFRRLTLASNGRIPCKVQGQGRKGVQAGPGPHTPPNYHTNYTIFSG